jgi:hypothetical protein
MERGFGVLLGLLSLVTRFRLTSVECECSSKLPPKIMADLWNLEDIQQ